MVPGIKVNNVSKVYPADGVAGHELFTDRLNNARVNSADKVAVAGVSFEVKEGDRIGIIGANGAGKSTLLHIIAGLSAPTSGTIDVTGKVTSILTLGVGLRELLSGRENIYIDGELQNQSRSEIERVIEDIIEFADLGEFIEHPVRTYSTGMKARLAFSMITHIEPEILIVDEALSAGDASFSLKATARIREICDKGKIVLLVSHSMAAITDMCNRCLWMADGKVIMDGTPDQVTKAYIESVRSSDEAALLEKFKKLIGSHSLKEGWKLQEVGIFSGNSRVQATMLEGGQPAFVRIKAGLPPSVIDAVISVEIKRLDGVIVFNESFSAREFMLPSSSIGLELEMSALALGTAIYRLDVGLGQADQKFALSSSIFEVFSLCPQSGGKPMLLYPVQISTLPRNIE